MKKILLGLLALSTTLMAESTGVTGNAGENAIDITTKAFILNSGLIITDSNGNQIQSVVLDHGTIMKGTNENSQAENTIYIKRSSGIFPKDAVINVEIDSLTSENKLTTTATPASNELNYIPHILSATIETEAPINVSNNTRTANKNYVIPSGNIEEVKVQLFSDIVQSNLATPTEGAYTNTSKLNVRYSKIPGTTTPVTEGRR